MTGCKHVEGNRAIQLAQQFYCLRVTEVIGGLSVDSQYAIPNLGEATFVTCKTNEIRGAQQKGQYKCF